MTFPVLGLSSGRDTPHGVQLVRAAAELGVDVVDANSMSSAVVTDMRASERRPARLVVLVARSAHGQAATWAPTEWIDHGGVQLGIAPGVDEERSALAQRVALEAAAAHGLVGVGSAHLDQHLGLLEFVSLPDDTWLWTIDGSLTSAYEQQVRALLNLPLGSTSMRARMVVTAPIVIGSKPDMYHPYLHLFARDPGLRVHQRAGSAGAAVGHLAVLGDDREDLIERAKHAAHYFSGVIDE